MMSWQYLFALFMALSSFMCVLTSSPASDKKASKDKKASSDKTFKFLYYTPMLNGSHYLSMSKIAKALVRQGHQVVFLRSDATTDGQRDDADFFKFLVFNSSYTTQDKVDMHRQLSDVVHKRPMLSPLILLLLALDGSVTGDHQLGKSLSQDCDDLLGDSATMARLRAENFDMMVGDSIAHCTPLLAQAINIPFILQSGFFVIPTLHGLWNGLPIDPSYMPERLLWLTDKMSFVQRLQNCLAYPFYTLLHVQELRAFDELKVKHNIKPEISTCESNKLALLHIYPGSFGLEFPRPMQPNTIYALFTAGLESSQRITGNVAEYLDDAKEGVVLFSLGTYVNYLKYIQAQMFADALALVPCRVLWLSKEGLPKGVKLANNTEIVKWLPLVAAMEHKNVRAYVGQGGAPTVYEAMWAGLPMVGIPLLEDQPDNILRVVNRGAGEWLDITKMTSASLGETITSVITEPRYLENAQRTSQIMRDLHGTSPPLEAVVHRILHVTKFGGDHLRPAVQDLSFVQRNLIDVYLFLFAMSALVVVCTVALCRCCSCFCRRTCCSGKVTHSKRE